MAIELSGVEARILGVLIEKSLATPGSYPMTLNALVAGASQQQNRDPIVAYADAEVSEAIRVLTRHGLIAQSVLPSGARAVRFEHRAVDVFHWDRREQAIMAELMLRGRQTAGELRTRANRMTPLQDVESVRSILAALARNDPPFVAELAREPGRSTNRFRQLISGAETEPPTATVAAPAPEIASAPESGTLGLAERVSVLEDQVAELMRHVAERQENANRAGDASSQPGV